jgi:hypothetical protein
MNAERVEAARWVRAHSNPDDVLMTNSHCPSDDEYVEEHSRCVRYAYSFWLSAYAERSVVVEGWVFAPRLAATTPDNVFWNPSLLKTNEETIYHPTADRIAHMRDVHHVRFIVVDRRIDPEGPDLRKYATLRHENARMAVYEIR